MVGGPRFRAALREAYVSMRKHGWMLRVGQQIIPWGSSDGVNPTDVLTAHDYSFFVVETEKTRSGAMSVLLSKAWPNIEASVVATPRHPTTVLLIPPGALPQYVTIAEAAPYEPKLENTEVAGKLKFSGPKWDFAWMGFRGFNHTPELEVVSADDMGAVVRQTHHRIYVAGIDGSASAGKLVARIEAAFVRTENYDGRDPTGQPTYLYGVFGLERPLGDRIRVQAQAIARSYPGWTGLDNVTGPDPATTGALQLVAAANALLLDYQNRYRPSGTLRIAYAERGATPRDRSVRRDELPRPRLPRAPAYWMASDRRGQPAARRRTVSRPRNAAARRPASVQWRVRTILFHVLNPCRGSLMSLLEVRDLKKTYAQGKHAVEVLRGVDVDRRQRRVRRRRGAERFG